jgi:DNA-binding MarR family transcriptional regulator
MNLLNLVPLLEVVTQGIKQPVRAIVSTEDMSVEQWRTLDVIFEHPTGLTLGCLSHRTRIFGPSITRIKDRLLEKKMIKVKVDHGDARSLIVSVTALGKRKHKKLSRQIDIALEQMEVTTDMREAYDALQPLVKE